MKIKRAPEKCAGCGSTHILLRCRNSLINGCDKCWCVLCWPKHSTAHDREWEEMSYDEREDMLKKY